MYAVTEYLDTCNGWKHWEGYCMVHNTLFLVVVFELAAGCELKLFYVQACLSGS